MSDRKQHPLIVSILLHLVPGMIILAFIFIFSGSFFTELLGLDQKLGPLVGYIAAIMFGLIPFQLGTLLWTAKKETGSFRIKRVLDYTNKSSVKLYLVFIPLLIIYFAVLFILVAPLIQPWIVETFFPWWPDQYNFQLILQEPTGLSGHKGIVILIVMYILFSCLSGPLVEELYFRGYLLPRMKSYSGKWAPLLHTILFSLYHFFSPWENLIRIIATFPMVYLVWKKEDIRFGIMTHVIINSIGGLIMLIAVLQHMNP